MATSPLTSPALWNDLHADYDKTIVPRFTMVALRGIELVAPASEAHVIDIACGPGTLTLPLARRVRHVTAVDFAASMIELLNRKCEQQRIGNVLTQVADGTALPFADATFDAAFSCFGLFLFADRAAGLREMCRITKPGAPIMISSWAPAAGPIEAMYQVVREVLPDLPFQKGSAPLGSEEELVTELSQSGLTEIRVESLAVPFQFPSVEEFWKENSQASAPLVATRRRVPQSEWPAVESRILHVLRGAFPTNVEFDRQAWLAVARVPNVH
jgi:ubiquinone/menaquinone biosynthesis C-methylase UbiE